MVRYSIVVPAYNAGNTIKECLSALFRQTVEIKDYEVIVVDDGSIDSTGSVARGFPVKCIRQDNKGPASARNNGAMSAIGEIILFTDADCVPENNWIEEMTAPFRDKGVCAVKGAYRTMQKGIVARFSQVEFEERFEKLKAAPSIDMVDTYSAGFRREVFLGLNGFDEKFPVANNEDTELSYRMSSKGMKMVFNPNAVVAHLNHPDSLKRYARIKFWRGYWRMVVYRRFPGKMLKDAYTPQMLKLQILLLPLMLASIVLFFLSPALSAYPLVFFALGFLVTSLPFLLVAFRRDPLVGIFSPVLLMLRAGSIGLGIFWGVLMGRLQNGR
ncbi:MAG: glycosyltransferase [Deltaproteobacteria bacterium]